MDTAIQDLELDLEINEETVAESNVAASERPPSLNCATW